MKELAKDLQRCYERYGLFDFEWFAEDLQKLGYRKIPENAVVILDEEMEEFAEKLAKSPQMQKVMSHLIKEWRKETAEKFVKEVDEFFKPFDKKSPIFLDLLITKIENIAKEITEG